jgi:hypothetical protein
MTWRYIFWSAAAGASSAFAVGKMRKNGKKTTAGLKRLRDMTKKPGISLG